MKLRRAQALAFVALIAGCGPGLADGYPDASADEGWTEADEHQPDPRLRVYHNPYAGVDWVHDRRLIAQTHDHVQTRTDYLDLYDDAGYDVVPLFHYTGIPSIPAAWTEIHWPAEAWLPADYVESLDAIERFYPGGEYAAQWHITAPFLAHYIEFWDPNKDPVELDHHYSTNQELIDQISANDGYPVLAHPWAEVQMFSDLVGLHGVEVYSAFAEMKDLTGSSEFNNIELMQAVWNDQLERDPQIYAVAVNDWHGPFCETDHCLDFPWVKDSGKTEIIAPTADSADVEDAFAHGRMFAVKDYGPTKLAYPRVESIEVRGASIVITAPGDVVWISHGQQVGVGDELGLDQLAPTARHVRAQVSDASGSTVFVQPFWLALRGDIDGDGDIDADDTSMCGDVLAGIDTQPDHVAAAADGC